MRVAVRGAGAVQLDVAFAPGVGIVTGGNGAGKTTLLRALQALEDVEKAVWPERLVSVEAEGVSEGADWKVRLQRDSSDGSIATAVDVGEVPAVTFIDPAEESQGIRAQFDRDVNAGDLLDGIDPAPFSEAWLDHASRILRREYDYIEVFEVEGADGDGVMPWFRISAMGVEYDILGAGRGELAAIYLLWRLSRIGDNTIVVVDEPEAWLASFSQARLKETLVFLSVGHGLHFVLTTHSPEMYLGLPGTRVSVLESLPRPTSYGPMTSPKAAHSLGAPMRPSIALLTEDAVAASLTEALIRRNDATLLEGVEIFHAQNGESALEQVQREFIDGDSRQRRINMMVILDGDQRRLNGTKRVKKDSRLYLPGNDAPDAMLKKISTGAVADLSDDQLTRLGVPDPVRFRMAISAAAGSDHHDWFIEVARGFSSYAAACDVLVQICLVDAEFFADAETLIRALAAELS